MREDRLFRGIIRYFRAMFLLACIVITIGLWITGFEVDTVMRMLPLYIMTMVWEMISFFIEK